MANIDLLEPSWSDATVKGVVRFPRNHALAPGIMDAEPTADEDYAGASIYVQGTPDILYANVADGAGTYNLQRFSLGRQRVLSGESSLGLTADMSGALIECDDATQAFVLPALTSANTGEAGLVYEFVVTTTVTTTTITAAAGDILNGGVTIMSTSAGAENDAFSADGVDDLIITMNGTTKGGIIGSYLKLWAAGATKWIVTGNLIGSGTLVTPFS